ncbi:MAG: D-alanine--D-alanine ligase [Myxococcales bacterium]|jgi:D-alanine-D-alanine ligase
MKEKRVGILMGGLSAEQEVSVASGEAIYAALTDRGYDATQVFVDRDVDQVLRQEAIDVAFLALHGTYGEDGCIQGLLELLQIPYTGPGVTESALAMDKLKSKELFRLHNVPTPPYYALHAHEMDALDEIHGPFGFPAFVKPRRQGSSIGAGSADDMDELHQRCEEGFQFDRTMLIERHVTGKEVAVGVLDGRALGGIEIVPGREFYDYRSKYSKGHSEYHQPPRLSPTRYQNVQRIAERAARALGVEGACRVDLLVTEGENEYVLEVNTLPGMTPTSLLPKIAAGAGHDFADLCELILARAALKMGVRGDDPDSIAPPPDPVAATSTLTT